MDLVASPETQSDEKSREEASEVDAPEDLPSMEMNQDESPQKEDKCKSSTEADNSGRPTCSEEKGHFFQPNSFLWAKQSKRGIYWPARVAHISDKIPKQPSDNHQWLYLYDSDSFMWIAKDCLMDLEAGREKNVAAGDKSKAFKSAFEKLEEERLSELSGTSPIHEKIKRAKATPVPIKKKVAPTFDSEESPSRPARTRNPVQFPGTAIDSLDTESLGSSGYGEDPASQASINEEDLTLTPDRVLDMLDKQLDMVSSSKYTNAANFSSPNTPTQSKRQSASSFSSGSASAASRKRVSAHRSDEPRSKKSPAVITCSDFSNDGLQLDELNNANSQEIGFSTATSGDKSYSITDSPSSHPPQGSASSSSSSILTNASSSSSSELPKGPSVGNMGGTKRANANTGGVAQIKPFRRTQPFDKNIGFIGVGNIGHNLVELLLTHSYNVFVWNKTPQKCSDLRSLGANTCISAGDVMSRSDVTFCCVSNVESVREVLVGTNGALNEMKRGKSFVNMTTSDPKTSTEFYQLIQMRGGRYLETPLLGSRKDSTEGSFLLLAAGDYTLYEEVLPCLELFSKKRSYVGAAGKACEMQLLMNLMYGNQLAVLAEVMALCRKSGVDRQQLLSVLQSSDLASRFLVDKAEMIVSGNEGYETVGKQLRHQQTDLKTVLNLSDQLMQAMPVTAACNELFKRALSWGDEELDMAAVYKAACL